MCARKPMIFAFVPAFLTEHDNLQFYSFPANRTEPGACYLASIRQLTGQQDPVSTSFPQTNAKLADTPLLFPDVYGYSGALMPSLFLLNHLSPT